MASTSVFNTTRFTALASGDVIGMVDISDTTQSAHGSFDSITVTNFFGSVPVPIVVTSTTGPQATFQYDGTHKYTISVASNGNTTLNATGSLTITPALTLSAALTYGGVTLSNAVTGTGNMVLATNPSLTQITLTGAVANSFLANGQTTGASYGAFINTSGNTIFGSDGSSAVISSGFAYASFFGSNTTKVVEIVYNGGVNTTFGASGAVTFTGAVSGVTTLVMSDYLTLGKAYVAGAVTATGTIAIKDNTGTVYNVLVHT